jgi:predicted enzyme related to lactoylglutathione lyase
MSVSVKSIDLCWITVSDLAKAQEFFTKTLGFKLHERDTNLGWLELKGEVGGAMLGVAQFKGGCSAEKPGSNAVATLKVDNIVAAKATLESKGVTFLGDIIEVPGHVKLASFTDFDGNKFQLVEELNR